eukprot:CAMPEP_0184488706 /NCGR_PEP_ID=MMETSP0113_2-20130426/13094_1 /TAXON_ID=91329 /ORGANISM="Norrisiella sphaerica, Strain BC52" /LENGTH=616 /DNA_ID=CAMNT_0026871669 /DNA_START=242 /DNA_END=2092 /DNA_ORIENTATION=+
MFIDFSSLVAILRKELKGPVKGAQDEATAKKITEILGTIRLNPREWNQYTHFIGNRYTRTLVGFDPDFAVLLLCWERGQMSPIHCHADSSCWVKVLDGQIQETLYEYPGDNTNGRPLRLISEEIYNANQATYIDDSHGIHKMGNPRDDSPCVSLHIYSPPYTACNVFERVSGLRKLVSLGSVYKGKPIPVIESNENESESLLSNVDKISLDTFVERVNMELASQDGGEKGIARLLEKLTLSPDEWERFVHFGEHHYTRNLLLLRERFSIMLLCWNPGQSTPPHAHGEERQSWFKVLSGDLEMTHYKEDEQSRLKQCSGVNVEAEVDSQYTINATSDVVYEGPNDLSHKLGNPSETETAVSLHVYSPPYLQLSYECSDSGEQKKIPVVHYGQMFSQTEGIGESWRGCDIFSNLSAFQSLLNEVFARGQNQDDPKLHQNITNVMSQIQINPEEWRSLAQLNSDHFTRVLIGQSDDWMLILTCWDKDQGTPIHDHHGSYNWIKVLDGNLLEEDYVCNLEEADSEKLREKTNKIAGDNNGEMKYSETCVRLVRSGVLPPDSVTFLNKNIIHRIRNVSGKPTFSLHLYSPPYIKAKAYDVVSGDTELIFLPQEKSKSMPRD